ncbi:MAG TPA: hypothetical protein VGR55_00385 [Candidatus Acidoferrum sp.]|nr:hypothetical protein [Candidatus Acidoferrum sp.]
MKDERGVGFVPDGKKKPVVPAPNPTFNLNVFIRIDPETIMFAILLIAVIIVVARFGIKTLPMA